MFDAAERSVEMAVHGHQRARGAAEVALAATGLRRLRQSGSAKALLPRTHGTSAEVVYLNTAGGLTGGDCFSLVLEVGDGARVMATTQTAERAYASSSGVASLDCRISVGADAAVAWLPQETILFDRSALTRRTVVDLSGNARFLMAETVVLGRTAMGETVTDLQFRDTREIRRGGRVVLLDPVLLETRHLARRDNPAVLDAAVAMSAIYLLAPDVEAIAPSVRRHLNSRQADAVAAGVSVWDGKLVIRLLSTDAFELRRVVAGCLRALNDGALPRVWQM